MAEASFPAGLEDFVADLQSAWRERSDIELKARGAAITQASDDRRSADRDILDRILERAAVSGAIDPRALTRGLYHGEISDLLDALVRSFDRRVVGDIWLWTMRASMRAPILRKIEKEGRLPELLADASAIATDQPGEKLRALLAGTATPDLSEGDLYDARPETILRHIAQLREWRQALDWLDGLPRFAVNSNGATRSIAVLERIADCDKMLARGFVGRARQLERLRQFLLAPIANDGSIPVMQVTGLGGIGKSTLLAKLMREAFAGPLFREAIPIKIDFDRLSFRAGGEEALSFEVSRQLGLAEPSTTGEFASLRATQQSNTLLSDANSPAASLRSAEEFGLSVRDVVIREGLDRRPVTLILDTFEEWQRPARQWAMSAAAGGNLDRLIEWARGLRSKMGLHGLRIIMSGRVTPSVKLPNFRREKPVRLGPLPVADRLTLLRGYGFNRKECDRISAISGGNPLSLHLAAKQLKGVPADEREAFLESSSSGMKSSASLGPPRSNMTTLKPRWVSARAAVDPPAPLPTIRTSGLSITGIPHSPR